MFQKDARKQVNKTEPALNAKMDTRCQDISALKKKSLTLDAMFMKAKANAISVKKDIESRKDTAYSLKNLCLRLTLSLILLLALEISEELEDFNQILSKHKLRLKLSLWKNVRFLIQEAVDA